MICWTKKSLQNIQQATFHYVLIFLQCTYGAPYARYAAS